jgi:transketolase
VDTITTIEPVAARWRAFGWDAVELDGHDVDAVAAALTAGRDGTDGTDGADGAGTAADDARPRILVCRTSTRHGLACLPPDADGHFVKLPADLAAAAEAELSAELCQP